MRRAGLALIVGVACVFSGGANASCDPCITAAAAEAGAAQVAAIAATTAAVQADVAATNALTEAISSAHSDIVQNISAQQKALLAQMQIKMEADARLSDVRMNTLTQAMKDTVKANEMIETERTYGERAMPKSGEVGTERAEGLKKGESEAVATVRKLQEDFYKWMNDPLINQTGQTGAKASTLLAEEEELWDPSPMLTKNIMTMDESKNSQKLIVAMVNHHPKRPLTKAELVSSPGAVDEEMKRRVSNARDMIAHEILAKRVVDRMPMVEAGAGGWGNGYAKPEVVDGKTSLQEVYRTEIEGRLTSEDWHLDVKTMTDAGLLREQVYLQAIRNKMLLEIMDQENKEGLMMALEQK